MNDKELVARQAAEMVKDGMLVGLGTGSTANYFIQELARRHTQKGLQVSVAASSLVSGLKAQELGLPLVAIEHLTHLDLYVDGADEVTSDNVLLKGRGYDLVREKLMARACDTFIVLVDQSKLVGRIGERYPIPVEVMPFAWQLVRQSLQSFGGHGVLRQNAAKDGFAMTSYGSMVLDMVFDPDQDRGTLNDILNDTPGVIEHGIFSELASAVFIAEQGQVQERWTG